MQFPQAFSLLIGDAGIKSWRFGSLPKVLDNSVLDGFLNSKQPFCMKAVRWVFLTRGGRLNGAEPERVRPALIVAIEERKQPIGKKRSLHGWGVHHFDP